MKLLHTSPEAEKLLVKLHDRHRLYSLAQNPEGEARAELASIMSDLLTINLSVAEHELITDVMMSILKQAEIELRRAVAERLSVMEDIPLRMILNLANDKIEVADPVLRRSRILSDMDLIYIVKAKGAEHGRSIATRPQLSEQLIEILLDEQDIPIAVNLTKNKSITIGDKALSRFMEMAEQSEVLAKPLSLREELSNEMLEKLYDLVGEDIKEHALNSIKPTLHTKFLHVVEDVIDGISKNLRGDFTPTSQMMTHAELLLARGNLNITIITDNLRRGQIAEFMAMFAVYCSLPKSTIADILKQEHGQGLAVACKAMDISKADFVNIFLMTARLRKNAIIKNSNLNRALSYYDKINQADALSILKESRH